MADGRRQDVENAEPGTEIYVFWPSPADSSGPSCSLLAVPVGRKRLIQYAEKRLPLRRSIGLRVGHNNTRTKLIKRSRKVHLLICGKEVAVGKAIRRVANHVSDVVPEIVDVFHYEHAGSFAAKRGSRQDPLWVVSGRYRSAVQTVKRATCVEAIDLASSRSL